MSTWQSIWSLNYDQVRDPSRLPDDAEIAVPLFASSEEDWQGPFSVDQKADDLAMQIYKNTNSIGMVERVKEVAERFGEKRIFLPRINEPDFPGKELLFFE